MSKKLGVKIPPDGISPNFIKNFPLTFLLEDRFLLDLGEINSLLGLMKLAPSLESICGSFLSRPAACPSLINEQNNLIIFKTT